MEEKSITAITLIRVCQDHVWVHVNTGHLRLTSRRTEEWCWKAAAAQGGQQLGVKHAAPLCSSHPSTTYAPLSCIPPLMPLLPTCPEGQCILPETSRGGFAGGDGLQTRTLCYVEWRGLIYLGLNIHIYFPALARKVRDPCSRERAFPSCCEKNTRRPWNLEVCPGDPPAGSSEPWRRFSTWCPPGFLPPEVAARREVPGVKPPPVPPLPSLPSNRISLKAGGGNANQHSQRGSGTAYIKEQKTRLQ